MKKRNYGKKTCEHEAEIASLRARVAVLEARPIYPFVPQQLPSVPPVPTVNPNPWRTTPYDPFFPYSPHIVYGTANAAAAPQEWNMPFMPNNACCAGAIGMGQVWVGTLAATSH